MVINMNKMISTDVEIEHFDNGASIFTNLWLKESIDYDFADYLRDIIREKGKQTKHWNGLQEVSFMSDSDYKRLFLDFACMNSEADEFENYFESEEFEKLVNKAIASFMRQKPYNVDFNIIRSYSIPIKAENKEDAEEKAMDLLDEVESLTESIQEMKISEVKK